MGERIGVAIIIATAEDGRAPFGVHREQLLANLFASSEIGRRFFRGPHPTIWEIEQCDHRLTDAISAAE